MGLGRVVIIKIVEKIYTSVKVVEEATTNAKSSVQKLDGTNERASKDIL